MKSMTKHAATTHERTAAVFGQLNKNLSLKQILMCGLLICSLSGSVSAGCVSTPSGFDYKCPSTITQSCIMNESLNSTGTCSTIGADNITINGSGYSITGNSTGDGIYATG